MATASQTALALDFPILEQEGLVYLDSAATSQKPRVVLDALEDFLAHHNANVHRGVYPLAVDADTRFNAGREQIAAFVGAQPAETIITKNATEAINLVSYSWGLGNVGAGDAIVLTEAEHHSNIVPWQQLCSQVGAELRWLEVDQEGMISLDQLDQFLADGRVKMVAVTHCSNVLGTINPVEEIVARARAAGAASLIDGSQAAPHMGVNVDAIGADFYVWTGHKAYGPTGIGLLHGRREMLEAMPPFLTGGDMIKTVSFDETTYNELPFKFEAGTPPIAEVVALGAAVDFITELGIERVRAHEEAITAYALASLQTIPGLTIQGPPLAQQRGGLVSFTLDCAHPHDVAEILGRDQVCVRAGHHCTQPLMKKLGLGATTRASFAVHTSTDDIDALVDSLGRVLEIFGD
jgi:cysteine desulfurase/selenocysteine lyase